MKATFKPLGLAAAVAAVSAGYAGIANAQSLAGNSSLGDLAIVPYYTTLNSYSTGVSVINTSNETQVVKIRFRRALDSMDALDFNVIMSPEDVWTGYIQAAGNAIKVYSQDSSCTAPAMTAEPGFANGGSFTMPNIFREGAEEGYVEIIAMAAADENQPISVAAKHDHSTGVPKDCARVRDNFFAGTSPSNYGVDPNGNGFDGSSSLNRRGVINSAVTKQCATATCPGPVVLNEYEDSGNVLKVSYFIKSDETGLELGYNAVHFADFMTGPSMTNQQVGVNEGDLQGFDHPDLNGGAPMSASGDLLDMGFDVGQRGSYWGIREAIGGATVINDWSANQTDLFTVDTDWVVTTPGQYLMTHLAQYIDAVEGDYGDKVAPFCNRGSCDFRDIPMEAIFTVYDREERGITVQEGDLVVSPQPPGEIVKSVLDQEVNVIKWGVEDVLGSAKTVSVPKPEGAQAGWASLDVIPYTGTRAICDIYTLSMLSECDTVNDDPPLVGFVAWQRNFGANPDANYGRIVEHSYHQTSSVQP